MQDPKTRYFYSTDITLWIEFYKICTDRNISNTNEKEREKILLELMEQRGFKNCAVVDSILTKEELIPHLQTIYGSTLDLSDPDKVNQWKKAMEARKMKGKICQSCKQATTKTDYGEVCINNQCVLKDVPIYSDPETDIESNWTDEGIQIEPLEDEDMEEGI